MAKYLQRFYTKPKYIVSITSNANPNEPIFLLGSLNFMFMCIIERSGGVLNHPVGIFEDINTAFLSTPLRARIQYGALKCITLYRVPDDTNTESNLKIADLTPMCTLHDPTLKTFKETFGVELYP